MDQAEFDETTGLPGFDETTHRPIFPKSSLEHGAYYMGRCRNACIARWDASRNCFLHWRVKFGAIYLEEIKHPVDEPQFDVFRVLGKLEFPKFEIPLDNDDAVFAGKVEDLNQYNDRVWCTCHLRNSVCIAEPCMKKRYLERLAKDKR